MQVVVFAAAIASDLSSIGVGDVESEFHVQVAQMVDQNITYRLRGCFSGCDDGVVHIYPICRRTGFGRTRSTAVALFFRPPVKPLNRPFYVRREFQRLLALVGQRVEHLVDVVSAFQHAQLP